MGLAAPNENPDTVHVIQMESGGKIFAYAGVDKAVRFEIVE